MFKPTPALQRSVRRLALTTKQAGKDFYKGTGSGSMGKHTKWGGYQVDFRKVRTFKVPDLEGFQLTPFVTRKIEQERGRYMRDSNPMDGKAYLERWKQEGGVS